MGCHCASIDFSVATGLCVRRWPRATNLGFLLPLLTALVGSTCKVAYLGALCAAAWVIGRALPREWRPEQEPWQVQGSLCWIAVVSPAWGAKDDFLVLLWFTYGWKQCVMGLGMLHRFPWRERPSSFTLKCPSWEDPSSTRHALAAVMFPAAGSCTSLVALLVPVFSLPCPVAADYCRHAPQPLPGGSLDRHWAQV